MPKVKPLIWTAKPQCDALSRNIKICMLKRGITPYQLAELLGICRASAYNRITMPGKMQYEELCRLAHIFKVDVADLVKEGGV